MTQSIYVIGGAGSGKSTFTAQLIDQMELTYGPLLNLHSLRNAKALVTLRGHELFDSTNEFRGFYLGVQRESFPGSDGLDRASSPTGEAWLQESPLPPLIISEGATLATRRFLYALHHTTDLLLVHLHAPITEVERRFKKRGSEQAATFVLNTVTRSANLGREMRNAGVQVLHVDTTNADQVELGLDICTLHAVAQRVG